MITSATQITVYHLQCTGVYNYIEEEAGNIEARELYYCSNALTWSAISSCVLVSPAR